MKQRFTGRINGDVYEVLAPDGGVSVRMPLSAARQDTKLKAAIERNGWPAIPAE